VFNIQIIYKARESILEGFIAFSIPLQAIIIHLDYINEDKEMCRLL